MSTSKKYLMAAAGSAGGAEQETFWIQTIGGTVTPNTVYFPRTVEIDSNDEIVITGNGYDIYNNAVDYDGMIHVLDRQGNIKRAISQSQGTNNIYSYGCAMDSSDNIYHYGLDNSAPHIFVTKIATDNSITWQKTLYQPNANPTSSAIDSSGNFYGVWYTSANDDAVITKWNSSGVVQWERQINYGTQQCYHFGIDIDSSGNPIAVGYTTDTGSGNAMGYIYKWNSSGTLQWAREVVNSSGNCQAFNAVVDSNDNIIVAGYAALSGSNQFFIGKWNSSGTLQWIRSLGATTDAEIGRAVTVDTSDNIYFAGVTRSVGTSTDYQPVIAKYNSSGTIQWQNVFSSNWALGGGATPNQPINIAPYGGLKWSLGSVIMSGYLEKETNNDSGFVLKVPDDGSLTGTYDEYVYATSTLTDADASSTLSSRTATGTEASWTGSSHANGSSTLHQNYNVYDIS